MTFPKTKVFVKEVSKKQLLKHNNTDLERIGKVITFATVNVGRCNTDASPTQGRHKSNNFKKLKKYGYSKCYRRKADR